MKTNRKLAIVLGSIAILIVLGVITYTGFSALAGEVLEMNLLTFFPIVLDRLDQPIGPSPEFVVFTPVWELGASSADPTIGANGEIKSWYTKHTYDFGTKIDLELYIHVKGGSAGVGTGSYEIYLPDELEPALDWYVGHANVWIAGGGISEFDGSIKWTFRNEVKGPKLIFTFDGREWSRTTPKSFADLKLRANISYWLQDIDPPS